MLVFYSWQSDTVENDNRFFIRDALKTLSKDFAKDGTMNVTIDQATRDEPGSPNIAETIFKKIDEASLFICDVTLISHLEGGKKTPNPNVLIELGYAIKKLGNERVICIFNSAFGKPEELPFDIRQNRILPFAIKNDERAESQKKLLSDLKIAILTVDRKAVTGKKVELFFYDPESGRQFGSDVELSGAVLSAISKEEFVSGITSERLESLVSGETSSWQAYLKKLVQKENEKSNSLKTFGVFARADFDTNIYNQNYYEEYVAAALLRRNSARLFFSIQNNNDQAIRDIKIVIYTKRNSGVVRRLDYPDYPDHFLLQVGGTSTQVKSLFESREIGNRTQLSYSMEILYGTEEVVLDEPLFLPLWYGETVELEYEIFSSGIGKITGTLTCKCNVVKGMITPEQVFLSL